MHRTVLAARLGLASVVGGLVLGVAGRVLMRVIARQSGLPGSYSIGGSIEVVLFGALLGAPVALLFWILRPRLPLRTPMAGVILGLLAVGVLTVAPPPAARSALAGTPDNPRLTWLGFGLLFTLWGSSLDYVSRWVWRAAQREPRRPHAAP